ncbi:MAG: hypothetical protein QM778_01225 [Myxococcales bacterium]
MGLALARRLGRCPSPRLGAVLGVLLAGLPGCEASEAPPPTSAPAAHAAVATHHDTGAVPAPAEPVVPALKPREVRPTIGAHSGELHSSAALDEGARLAADTLVTLAEKAQLVLQFPGGASVKVLGPARLAVPAGELGLLLRQGTVSVDLEFSALHPESGFWLATPSARLELVHGGRFVVRAFEYGGSALSVVTGPLAVTPAGGEGQAPKALAAGAKAQLAADGKSEFSSVARRPGAGISLHLQTEEVRLAALPERRGADLSAATRSASAVAAACDAVVTARTEEHTLQARHRALVAQKDPGAMEVQRALAAQGARSFEARRALEKRLSLLEAERLEAGSQGLASPEIARARELLR